MFAFLALTFTGLFLQASIVNAELFKEDKLYSVLKRLDRLEQKVESLQVENRKLQEENENLKEENSRIRSRLTTLEKQNATQKPYSGSKPQTTHEKNEEIQNYAHRLHNTKEHKIKEVNDIVMDNYHYKRLLIGNTTPMPTVTTPKVAFAVQLSKEITKLRSHQIIEYDKVFLNDGNGFDVRHGHFTAPVKGVYLLSVIIYTDRSNDLYLDLVKNGQVVTVMYVNGNTDYASSTIVLPILLQQGDMVWVRTHSGNEGKTLPGFSEYMLNAFTGTLLYAL
ncbi:C1QL [Mytilus coruscus]|uniref:C1QL n=1 Tax=Mytilus coruscus TaxID=42192 RepID=A0A6J8DJP8_MYTCO|nr:C1QL [Mytilus coruscus]